MAHVSVGLDQDLHVEKLIYSDKVRFEDNVQIYLAHTNCKHHKVTKEMLVTKWGIYNLKSEATLEATTNMCVGLDILIFYKRYRTELLSLRLRWLKMKILIDNMFAGVKSLMVNTCTQLFNDNEHIYIHPMKRKKEDGDGL